MTTTENMDASVPLLLEQRADAWSTTAPSYDLFAENVTLPFAEDAARLVTIGHGTRALDIATGTGNFAFACARRGATVLATDFAPGMLELLGQKAVQRGLESRIDVRVMDGQALELPDETFDVVGSIFGLLFFPDHDRGLREMLRVLGPGGRAVVSTWAPPPRGDMFRLIGGAMSKAIPDLPASSDVPHWLALGDADAFRDRLLANGFAAAHVVELRHAWVFDRLDTLTSAIPKCAPPMVAMFESMTDRQRAIFLDAMADDLRARQGDGPYAITHEALIAVGTKAAR